MNRNAPQPATAESIPALQYANGKTMARTSPSGRFAPLIGFHVERGKDAELDDAMEAIGTPWMEIKHQREGAPAVIAPHWSLGDTVVFHPVTAGPVVTTVGASVSERYAAQTADAGLGMRWAQGEKSRMAVRGFVAPLVKAGYLQPLQLGVRSRMTDVLLAALLDHGRVCEAADGLIDRTRHPEPVYFHEVGLPLGPGDEEEWGKGDTATVVPFRSLHPATVDADYLRATWRSQALHSAALEAWAAVQAWAWEYAQEVVSL